MKILLILFLGLTLNSCSKRSLYNGGEANEVVEALPFKLAHALDVIYETYGDRVQIKNKVLTKFGQNELVGTSFATIMTLPAGTDNETYVSANSIDTLSSSNTGDNQLVTIEGHTISGSNLTFLVQTATVLGQNKVTLSTPLARVNRVYNSGATDFSGNIYVYEDQDLSAGVPQTASGIHLIVPSGGQNQSFKASTSTSSQDYWLLTSIVVGVDKKTSASVDVELQVRQLGGVFRTLFEIPVSTNGTNAFERQLDPVIIIPKNSDVRLRARASTTTVSVSGRVAGYLALIQN